MNFVKFRAFMMNNMRGVVDSRRLEQFVKEQWRLLRNGVRGVEIHDSACIAWTQCGGKI